MEDRQAPVGESGFSLIEVLIAAGILMMIALGILPIFAQAIVNNRAGADYTQATNHAKSELERLYSLPMNSPELAITAAPTVRTEYFSQRDQKWVDGEAPVDGDDPADDMALWTRTTTLQQFGVGALVDTDRDGKLDNPLPAGTADSFVHFKEIEVRVESGRGGGPLGAGKRITLRILKAY
ncbi:MAG TPA: hypothetical protein VKK31_17165 [Thermoanaerobaculia bacterium]|nr:hypothetical protein [Thermoanaerobaculia bacterium]